ncbi:MAG: Gfo/Idh/MocA family oxidoreductase [Clostridia bacterium]|nr:Gfo/Idh/MocA family oxidoreductase [Clostridia bacterium]
MLKVGLIGVGGISGAHIPCWEQMEDAELVALCDIRPEQMKPYPGKRCYASLTEMLDAEELDILDICLPTYLHADAAVQALEKGVHVLCEKPISLKTEDVARIYAAAERNHVTFMVAQVLRFWPEYEFVKQLYDTGKYGKLLSGTMTRLGNLPAWSWDNWMADEKRSGLVPFDLHIHDLDFMVYAFGKPVDAARCRTRREDQDHLMAQYNFGDFTIHSEAAWYAPQSFNFNAGFRFQFEKAVVVSGHEGLVVYEKDGGKIHVGSPEGESAGLDLPATNAYANEIRYFADCVKQGIPADKVKPCQLETVLDLLNAF